MSPMSTQQSAKTAQAVGIELGEYGTHRTSNRSQGHRRRVTHWENICTKHWGNWKGAQRRGILDFDWCRVQGRTDASWPREESPPRWASDPRSSRECVLSGFLFAPKYKLDSGIWRLLHLVPDIWSRASDSVRYYPCAVWLLTQTNRKFWIILEHRSLISRRLRQSNWLPAIRAPENLTLGSPDPC